ncbi:MAG: hypothetical protein LAO05_06220 [Acidobacteriia bacterium]|nr:hypothetical protein [Terriglobia bacterium]
MADFRTPEDVKAHYVERMGEELGLLFHELWQEVALLRIEWGEFIELFGEKRSRVALMNEAAPAFFTMVQRLLWEETLLSIARLTDPPSSMGKDNLTIRRLTGCIDDSGTAQEVSRCAKEAADAADFCRDWRNRRIAHRDLALATKKETATPLELGNRVKVEAALLAIERTLNAVGGYYTGSTTHFDLGSRLGGALSMLYALRRGAKAEAAWRARLERGEPTSEDREHEEI